MAEILGQDFNFQKKVGFRKRRFSLLGSVGSSRASSAAYSSGSHSSPLSPSEISAPFRQHAENAKVLGHDAVRKASGPTLQMGSELVTSV